MQSEEPSARTPRYFVESLSRGLAILALLSAENRSTSLSEACQSLGLNKSTGFRLLTTLRSLGYLEQDPDTKRYWPTHRILQLGYAALDGMALGSVAVPHMRALSKRHGESVSLAVLVGHEIVFLERIEASQLLSVTLAVGSRLPVHCTSMGKMLLACQPPGNLDQILKQMDFAPRGPNTLPTADALLRDLEIIRQRGYSINDEELAAGVRAVAAPVESHSGGAIAAVNVAFPCARVSMEMLKRVFAPDAVAAAKAISSDWAIVSRAGGSGV